MMSNNRFVCYTLLLGLLVIAGIAGCTNEDTTSSGGGGSSDLSKIGLTPDTSWHDSYLVGSHTRYSCDNCHTSTARTKGASAGNRELAANEICYTCHAGNYNSTSLPNHTTTGMDTYCNSCHYSDNFRSHLRVSHTEWHSAVSTSCATCHSGREPSSHSDGRNSGCENCHTYSSGSWGLSGGSHTYTSGCSSCHASSKPANHYGDTCESCHTYPSWSGAASGHTYTSGCSSCHSGSKPANHYGDTCENCHTYPSWSAATGMDHTGISTGCSSCHSRHYSGYACEWCHTSGISWSYSHSRVNSSACNACHSGDGHGDEGGGDDHRDDYD